MDKFGKETLKNDKGLKKNPVTNPELKTYKMSFSHGPQEQSVAKPIRLCETTQSHLRESRRYRSFHFCIYLLLEFQNKPLDLDVCPGAKHRKMQGVGCQNIQIKWLFSIK